MFCFRCWYFCPRNFYVALRKHFDSSILNDFITNPRSSFDGNFLKQVLKNAISNNGCEHPLNHYQFTLWLNLYMSYIKISRCHKNIKQRRFTDKPFWTVKFMRFSKSHLRSNLNSSLAIIYTLCPILSVKNLPHYGIAYFYFTMWFTENRNKATNKYLSVATISQKYFGILLLFLTVSFHQKWIRTRLLSPKIDSTNKTLCTCLCKCQCKK